MTAAVIRRGVRHWGIALCALGALAGCVGRAAPQPLRGVWHAVRPGETPDAIAAQYGAKGDAVAAVNGLSDSPVHRAEVFVPLPGGRAPGAFERPDAASPPSPAGDDQAATAPAAAVADDTSSSTAAAVVPAPAPPAARTAYQWPVQGTVVSGFGTEGNEGIDIAAPEGTPVVAARAGTVVYSGDGIAGYGNLILVRHEDGVVTVYAHNKRNAVQRGDTVIAGQTIAFVGQTGAATRPMVHFEIRIDQRPVDPIPHLPPTKGRP